MGPWANIFADEIAQIFPSCPLKFQRNFIGKQISRKMAMFVRLTAICKFKGTIYTIPFLSILIIQHSACPAIYEIGRTSPFVGEPYELTVIRFNKVNHPPGEFLGRQIRGSVRRDMAK